MVSEMKKTEVSWQTLSPDQKLGKRLEAWASSSSKINFSTPQAEKDYRARIARYISAIQLKNTPDRVPVVPTLGGFAAAYCGYSEKEIMYDAAKAADVAMKCTLEFQIDTKIAAGGMPGRMYEALDCKLYDWPGHGVAENDGLQFNEGEYMKADEYDDLIEDPSDFILRDFLPRTMGALAPLATLLPLSHITEGPPIGANVSRYGLPEVQEALASLMKAGREMLDWQQKLAPTNSKLDQLGFPGMGGGSSRAPFDHIGDTLRGTRGIVQDMYGRPKKLLQAMERLTPIMIKMGVKSARMGDCPVVGMPLHKGADGWMSDEQFRTFYWPSLRKVILGLIEEGLVPRLFAEGGYNSRLEALRDLPKGKTVWQFDYTDMAKAKEILGDVACIMGNVPVALIHTGTPEQTEAYCRKLIDTAAKGGGFIFSTGAGVGRGGKVENVRAMIKCAREYGVYS